VIVSCSTRVVEIDSRASGSKFCSVERFEEEVRLKVGLVL